MAARIRIGDADRDRLAGLLREHFTAGRLNMDELDRRLGLALTAEYADEAAAVFTDLPGGAGWPLPGGAGPVSPGGAGPVSPGGAGPVSPGGGVPGVASSAGSASSVSARGRRVRGRHGQSTTPDDSWVPTSERFRDPSSGTIMRVWVDPADDSRHYVPDA
jgi:uncharacterized protein DUF1707